MFWLCQVAQARGGTGGAQRAHEDVAHAGLAHRFDFHQVRAQVACDSLQSASTLMAHAAAASSRCSLAPLWEQGAKFDSLRVPHPLIPLLSKQNTHTRLSGIVRMLLA